MARRILLGCFEIPGYGGASTASYRLLELMRERGLDVSYVNLVDEQDADFFRYAFGESYGNPRSLGGVFDCVLSEPLFHPQPELSKLIEGIGPDVLIGVGFIAALLMKRAARARPLVFLTSGCQQAKDAIIDGRVTDFLDLRHEIERGLRPPRLTCREEREAVGIADLVVVHSDMTRLLYGYYYPYQEGKVHDRVLWFAEWIYADALEYAPLRRPFGDRDVNVLFLASSWARPEKNYPFVRGIARQMRGARVHVVGEAASAIEGAVHHGLVPGRRHIFDLMGRAKAVVCPSSFDAAPGILYEASAMGCNLVASENCGNWAICNEALLVERFTAKEFARKAAAALETKVEDRVGAFLSEDPFRDFLETLEVV